MPKQSGGAPLIDAQESTIISSLNKRIKELEEEVSRLKANEQVMHEPSKGIVNNAEYQTLIKDLRKLKGVEQRCLQLTNDNEKHWEELSKRDKEIIQLKNRVAVLEDELSGQERLKADKKLLQEKVKRLEK